MSNLVSYVPTAKVIEIHQKMELAELFGYETRNKYQILDENGQPIGFAAEQQKGFWNFLVRQFLGHWRRFDILIFDMDRKPVLRVTNRFRWIFQYVEVRRHNGEFLGALEQRFAIFSKKFDVHGPRGEVLMQMRSPLWKIWTFTFFRKEQPVAVIEKKWAGLLTEAFTDKDKFRVRMDSPTLTETERWLLLAAALFVDLNYFEYKAQ